VDDVTFDGTCPWCGAYIEDVYEYSSGTSEDFGFECPDCGKSIDGWRETTYRLERAGEDAEG
jgi:transposase-like protein